MRHIHRCFSWSISWLRARERKLCALRMWAHIICVFFNVKVIMVFCDWGARTWGAQHRSASRSVRNVSIISHAFSCIYEYICSEAATLNTYCLFICEKLNNTIVWHADSVESAQLGNECVEYAASIAANVPIHRLRLTQINIPTYRSRNYSQIHLRQHLSYLQSNN